MTKNNRFIRIFLISFLVFFCFPFYAEEVKKWTVAVEKFNLKGGDYSAVNKAVSELIPLQIVSNLSGTTFRNILPDEEYEREFYKLKNERISLFLQLDAAVKSRDAVFLQNYSEKALHARLKEEEKKIADIKTKINENLQKVQEAARIRDSHMITEEKEVELSRGQKIVRVFKGLVSKDKYEPGIEKVVIYDKSSSGFLNISEQTQDEGYESYSYEKEVIGKGINSVIKGDVQVIGEFMAVTCELLIYPGAKSAGVITEIGSFNEVEYISASLSNSLQPLISSSLPVEISVTVNPPEAKKDLIFSIDDVAYKNLSEKFITDSGVHSIRFDSPGFKTCMTSYFFEGNEKYSISVEMKEVEEGLLKLDFSKNLPGSVYANGELMAKVSEEKPVAEIKINDSKILGQFINSEGGSGFFYVPGKLVSENKSFKVKAKTYDRGEYIELRRKRMYGSYSVFLVSILGSLFCYGNYSNCAEAFIRNPERQDALLKKTLAWQTASDVTIGVTVGTGVWFGYELVRYFMAADSVLPVKAKEEKNKEDK